MNIFEESDYKKILKFILKTRLKSQRGIFKKISDHLGVNPSLISQILSGSKDFSEEQMLSICQLLELNKIERNYFLALVQIERAGSASLAEVYRENLQMIRQQAMNLSERINVTKFISESDQIKFYSSWLYSAIQLFTTLDRSPKLKDICIRFKLTEPNALKMLDFLIEIGLVKEEKGVYKPGHCETHLDKKSPLIAMYHKNWRQKAMHVADFISENELMYSCSFSVSQKDFLVIREEFIQSIQKFLKTTKESPAEDLAQLNLDLFWIKS